MGMIQYNDDLGLNKANTQYLEMINEIIEEYQHDGYILTLRQLYYQLVSRDIIANKDSEYKKLGRILAKGRLAGVVDWEAIEDRTREPDLPWFVESVHHALTSVHAQYRLDRMMDQDVYLELWVEKDALSGVLERVSRKYHINLMVNRGYSSWTAIHDAAMRFRQARGKLAIILYLGDHDPSGLDMINDIRNRLQILDFDHLKYLDMDYDELKDQSQDCLNFNKFYIKHIGLTMDQIKEYNPPPNPTKKSDPRSGIYIGEHGHTCWEVDALEPKVLISLVNDSIKRLIDIDRFNAMVAKENKGKLLLQKLIKQVKNKE